MLTARLLSIDVCRRAVSYPMGNSIPARKVGHLRARQQTGGNDGLLRQDHSPEPKGMLDGVACLVNDAEV